MKTKLFFLICLLLPIVGTAQEIFRSWDGAEISPNGKIRALNIFINVIYDVHPDTNRLDDMGIWDEITDTLLEGVNTAEIPSYLSIMMDTHYVAGQTHGLTRLLGEASFDSLQLTQNETPAQFTRDTETGLFAKRSVMVCNAGSYFQQRSGSEFILERGSTLLLRAGSRFVVGDSAVLHLTDGSRLVVEPGAELEFQGCGKLLIDSTALTENHGRMAFGENSWGIVNPGGELIVDGGTLTNLTDGTLWQGIRICGNKDLIQTSDVRSTPTMSLNESVPVSGLRLDSNLLENDSLLSDTLDIQEDTLLPRCYQSFFGTNSTKYSFAIPTYCFINDEDDDIYNSQMLGCCWTAGLSINSNDTFRENGFLYYACHDYVSDGYLREDTTLGQLFFLQAGEERLVCDMSLQKGDTFKIPYMFSEYWFSNVIVADSIYYTSDNKKRIDFHCLEDTTTGTVIPNTLSNLFTEYLNIKMSFIEGIGPIYAPVGGILDLYGLTILLCVQKDDTLAYMTDERLGCYQLLVDVKEVEKKASIALYPNPARDQINVKLSEWKGGGTLYVMNAMGMVVASRTINEPEFALNVAHLANGFYTMLVLDDKGRRSSAKFVKEE